MAPEEWVPGSTIDERTTVYNLGRAALVLLDTRDLDGTSRGSAAAHAVLQEATRAEADARFSTVEAFVDEWRRRR